MEMIAVTPERNPQLEKYAQRHGQDAATALDDVLADYLAWEEQDYEKSVEAIRRGNEDVVAGRTRPAEEVSEALRLKYGLPR